MIVGQFVDTYPPCLDGVGRVTQSYCETLMSMGHEAWYIAPKAPGTAAEYAFPVLLQHSVKLPGEQFRLGLPGLDIRYRRRLEDIPFDIVHAQSPFAAGEEALRMARRRQVPLVSTFHSKYYQDFYDKTKSKVIAQGVVNYIIRFYNQCDGVWTVNHATAQVLREYGYHGKIRIMENGTNREPLSPEGVAALNSRVRLGHDPVLLFVGQHNYKKNIHGILEACALLKRQGVRFELVTAGDGPDMEAIRSEVEEKGLAGQTHLLGFMADRAELMALYHRADLLVFPSIYDNAPMVLREAAAMGTPAVVVRGSCSAEGITDGENGFICADESGEAIAQAVDAVLAEHRLSPKGVKQAATIDLKKDEPGLLAFCQDRGLPLRCYPAEELAGLPGDFTPSAFVQGVTGVDNVCERAALLDAEKLIVQKTARDGVTVAVAAEHWEVRFG